MRNLTCVAPYARATHGMRCGSTFLPCRFDLTVNFCVAGVAAAGAKATARVTSNTPPKPTLVRMECLRPLDMTQVRLRGGPCKKLEIALAECLCGRMEF